MLKIKNHSNRPVKTLQKKDLNIKVAKNVANVLRKNRQWYQDTTI
jgi:hypothetical protein